MAFADSQFELLLKKRPMIKPLPCVFDRTCNRDFDFALFEAFKDFRAAAMQDRQLQAGEGAEHFRDRAHHPFDIDAV